MSLNDTPRANRLHIGIFGKRNSGKSSLINVLTGQNISVVSDKAGTTTDPVYKSMELHPVGPVVFIDTAGFDDEGELGQLRVEKTEEILDKTDIAILVFGHGDISTEQRWLKRLEEAEIPVIPVLGKADLAEGKSDPGNGCSDGSGQGATCEKRPAADEIESTCQRLRGELALEPILVSALEKTGLTELRKAIENAVPEDFQRQKILGNLAGEGELVLLVMPQDIQAPKGRLILPQVQTIRELLDNRCTTVCTTADRFRESLSCLSEPPALIITDSQCFPMVYAEKPAESELTSFSVLFAAYKGDIGILTQGAAAIEGLTAESRVLIAEACTHAPLEEDIGRVKIPALLRKKYGQEMQIDVASGKEFPENLADYDLVIHCGACMFNRRHVLTRIAKARAAGVPITNYGITIAKLSGILDKIKLPEL